MTCKKQGKTKSDQLSKSIHLNEVPLFPSRDIIYFAHLFHRTLITLPRRRIFCRHLRTKIHGRWKRWLINKEKKNSKTPKPSSMVLHEIYDDQWRGKKYFFEEHLQKILYNFKYDFFCSAKINFKFEVLYLYLHFGPYNLHNTFRIHKYFLVYCFNPLKNYIS